MNSPANNMHRRRFLVDTGMGFTGMALSAMLFKDGIASPAEKWSAPDGKPHHPPKAKSVIWLFMIGGASHLESFDPKPALNKYAGKAISDTPYQETLHSPYLKNERIVAPDANGQIQKKIYPLQIGYKKRGESGIEVSDWFSHVGSCIDDISVIRSMWTQDSNHGAQLEFHQARHVLDGYHPTVGAWANYGLGTLNENLPQFVVLGRQVADCCGGKEVHRASYLGPQYDGVVLKPDPNNPLPFAAPAKDMYREEQLAQFKLLNELGQLSSVEYPRDEKMKARIKSYELAFRMQTAIPEAVNFNKETKATLDLYATAPGRGLNEFGKNLLVARRLVERGVRFIQIYHGSSGGAGSWDAHSGLKKGHANLCGQTDRPTAGLLKDLKQRGLLEDTLVVWGTEFGRTPGSQGSTGRDHHPYGFSCWMAGGGIKGGHVHGKTDEIGFHAVENRHYVSDIHATVLHQMGLDAKRLEVPGRKRIEIEVGKPIHDIIA